MQDDTRRILITGGCGFLGQYVIQELLNRHSDRRITALDLKINLNMLFDFGVYPNLEIYYSKNILDYDSMREYFDGIDVIIHLAGLVSFSLKDKKRLMRVNVEGTKNVLRGAAEANVKHFIHISSVAALGYTDDPERPADEKFSFDWKIAEKHHKYYMLSKHLADLEVEKYRQNGLNCVILYPGLMLGPGDLNNSAKLINALHREKIPFNAPGGTNVMDVRDAARGIAEVFDREIDNDNIILGGYNLTFKKVNEIIAALVYSKPPRKTLPRKWEAALYRLLLIAETINPKRIGLTADNLHSSMRFRYFDSSRAKETLNWQPDIEFEKTVNDIINWMRRYAQFD